MSENKRLRNKENIDDLKKELYKIRHDLDFIYNEICDPSNKKNKNICSCLYCYLIHIIRKKGREIAIKIIPERYNEFHDHVLLPLKIAKKLCSYDCQQSRFYLDIARKNLLIYNRNYFTTILKTKF